MKRILHRIIAWLRVDAVGVSMPGPRLAERIHSIVAERSPVRMSRARAACIAAACGAICLAFIAVTPTRAQSSDTLAWEKAAGGKMSFEAASVRANKTGLRGDRPYSNVPLDPGDDYAPTGGLFTATNLPVFAYMQFAYKLSNSEMRAIAMDLQKQGFGATTRYDIQARAADNATKNQMRLMMQTLLADRFKLKMHYEARSTPVFLLVLDKPGKAGPQLRKHLGDPPCAAAIAPAAGPPSLPKTSTDGLPVVCGAWVMLPASVPGRRRVGARNVSMSFVAETLSGFANGVIQRPLIDETGLTGTVDLMLEWTPQFGPEANVQVDQSGPTFEEALKDQLGIKLDSQTAPVQTLVVDHIEEPTPN